MKLDRLGSSGQMRWIVSRCQFYGSENELATLFTVLMINKRVGANWNVNM
jgi:hypothetical protein